MKTRLTYLNKGEFFEFQGNYFEKMEKREHGNRCKNAKTGEIISLPLMIYVDKIEEVPQNKPKKAKVKKVDLETQDLEREEISEQESLSDSVRLRDGWEEPTEL